MTQETKDKFAAILAAQTAKTPSQKFAEVQPEQPATPEISAGQPINSADHSTDKEPAPAKMVSFQIIWHEGTGEYDGKIFNNWGKANEALRRIGCPKSGYNKVKVCIKWENGSEITDRLDLGVSGGDLNPNLETVGEYLKNATSVMYASNLQKGDRVNLEWEDSTRENEMNQPAENNQEFKIVDYSEKSFAIPTEEKPNKEILAIFRQYGVYNKFLKCGKGWIFSKKHLPEVSEKLIFLTNQ